MEPEVPFIDEHATEIPAGTDEVWEATRDVVRRRLGGTPPRAFLAAWDLKPRERSGDWRGGVAVGQTLPGFEVFEATTGRRLDLRGRHRFSSYALVVELDEIEAGTRVRAQTWAEFPGPHGRVYRALVIGTGMHRMVVRRLLREAREGALRATELRGAAPAPPHPSA